MPHRLVEHLTLLGRTEHPGDRSTLITSIAQQIIGAELSASTFEIVATYPIPSDLKEVLRSSLKKELMDLANMDPHASERLAQLTLLMATLGQEETLLEQKITLAFTLEDATRLIATFRTLSQPAQDKIMDNAAKILSIYLTMPTDETFPMLEEMGNPEHRASMMTIYFQNNRFPDFLQREPTRLTTIIKHFEGTEHQGAMFKKFAPYLPGSQLLSCALDIGLDLHHLRPHREALLTAIEKLATNDEKRTALHKLELLFSDDSKRFFSHGKEERALRERFLKLQESLSTSPDLDSSNGDSKSNASDYNPPY